MINEHSSTVAKSCSATDAEDLDNLQPVARREICTAYGNKVQPLFTGKILGESSSPRWYKIQTDIDVVSADYYLVLWYVDADIHPDDPDPGFTWWGTDVESEGKAATYDYQAPTGTWDQEDQFDLAYRLLISQSQPDGLNNYREHLLGTNVNGSRKIHNYDGPKVHGLPRR
jgi:hypothetical protein